MNGDALFAFNRSGTADLLSGARGELDNLASRISKFDRLSSVVVVGHTDRIGSDNYNLSLSQRRAQTVANYLSSRGVPANVIRAEGAGEDLPAVECSDKLGRSELIACLLATESPRGNPSDRLWRVELILYRPLVSHIETQLQAGFFFACLALIA